MNIKDILHKIVPQSLWTKIRRKKIERRHRIITKEITPLVINFESYPNILNLCKEKPNQQKPIIWQYWAQGFEEDTMPGVLKICLSSVEKYASGFQIIRINDNNYMNYISLPDWIVQKKEQGLISLTHFSDILRFGLLAIHGGLWLDCAILLTGRIPDYVTNNQFFFYRRDPMEKEKEFWENTFAYYFGWSSFHKVNSLIGVLYSQKGNADIINLTKILYEYWRIYDKPIDYFFLQIIIDIYFSLHPDHVCKIVNDCILHYLRQILNGNPSKINNPGDVFKITTIHSLNYKNTKLGDRLPDILAKLLKEYNV